MRKLLGTLAGLVVLFLFVPLTEAAILLLYPSPPGLDRYDPVAFAAWAEAIPDPVLAVRALGGLAGALAGGWIALKASNWHAAHYWVLAPALGLAGWELAQFAHPLWAQVAMLVAPLLGVRLALGLPWRDYRRFRIA